MEISTKNQLNRVVRHNGPLKRPKKAKIENKGHKGQIKGQNQSVINFMYFFDLFEIIGTKCNGKCLYFKLQDHKGHQKAT